MNKFKMKKTLALKLSAILIFAGCAASVSSVNLSAAANTPFSDNPGSAPTPPPNNGVEVGAFKLNCEEAKFTHLLNIYRVSKGRAKVSVSKSGVIAARWHSQDMINKNYFSHTEPDGRAFNQRTGAFGYSAWAENIAAGNFASAGTFCQWKNSPGHDANMQGDHSSIGIGQVSAGGQYGVYWSNCFGGAVNDAISEPLTDESGCVMPTSLPGC